MLRLISGKLGVLRLPVDDENREPCVSILLYRHIDGQKQNGSKFMVQKSLQSARAKVDHVRRNRGALHLLAELHLFGVVPGCSTPPGPLPYTTRRGWVPAKTKIKYTS